MLKKEKEEDTNKWKDILCSWTGSISIVKLSLLPEERYRFNPTPNKIPMRFFSELEKNTKIDIKPQKTTNSQSNFEKEDATLPYFKLYHKAIIIKIV